MKVVKMDDVVSVVSKVLERNVNYIGVELGRGIFATIQGELSSVAFDCGEVSEVPPDTVGDIRSG